MTHTNKHPLYVHNVAKRLGIPGRTVRHWASIGKLPAVKNGLRKWIFDPDQIMQIQMRRAVL